MIGSLLKRRCIHVHVDAVIVAIVLQTSILVYLLTLTSEADNLLEHIALM